MKKNLVTLIRPPYVIPKASIFANKGVPALGLAYLSAITRRAGLEPYCIDSFARDMDRFTPIEGTNFIINGLTNTDTVGCIPKESKLIGLSCMFSSEWINTSKLIKEIKHKFPNALLVLGGEHVTADYEYILQNYPEVDYCILGEGENKFYSLLEALKSQESFIKSTPGLTYLDDVTKKIISNPISYRTKNIDEIPPPDWSGLNLEEFHSRLMGMSMMGKITIPMILSRGCPYQCTFCSSASMWTTRWVSRDIDQIVKEIKFYISEYKINHLDFFDLTAIVNKKWTQDFCKRMIDENLGITWSLPSGTRSEALTAETLYLIKKSGCTKITYAPESGSKIMSKKIKKKVNLENMLVSMRQAVKLGLVVKANIIFGFPDETNVDRLKNFFYIFKMALIGVHDVPCFAFTPYPGSELFDRLLREGKIKRDENYYEMLAELVYTKPVNRKSWNENLSPKAVPLLSLGGMSFFYSLQFLFRPFRFFKLLKNMHKNTPQTMLEAALANSYQDLWQGRRFEQKQTEIDKSNAA